MALSNPRYSLYALGSNSHGQLGIGHEEDVDAPTLCRFDCDATESVGKSVQFAAGGNHSLVLTDEGYVWAAGSNEFGQCGLPLSVQRSSIFKLAEIRLESDSSQLTRFSFVAATWNASILVASDGVRIVTFGVGSKGELGRGLNVVQCLPDSAWSVPNGAVVRAIAAGIDHVVALYSNGDVVAWGNGRNGQLGDERRHYFVYTHIAGLSFFPTAVTCGQHFTFIVGEEGDNVATSSPTMLGPDRDRFGLRQNIPAHLSVQWKHIDSCWNSVFVLGGDSELIAWGRNDKMQLPSLLIRQHRIARLAAGTEHVTAELDNGEVVTWGWGEHGNCGSPVDAKTGIVTSSDGYNVLKVSKPVTVLGAGAATTFLVSRFPTS